MVEVIVVDIVVSFCNIVECVSVENCRLLYCLGMIMLKNLFFLMNFYIVGGRLFSLWVICQLLIIVYSCLIGLLRKVCFFMLSFGLGWLSSWCQFGLFENSLFLKLIVLVFSVVCLVLDSLGVILVKIFRSGVLIWWWWNVGISSGMVMVVLMISSIMVVMGVLVSRLIIRVVIFVVIVYVCRLV